MNTDKNLIEKWLNDSLTPDERQQLADSGELATLERLDRAIKAFKAPEYTVQQELERALSSDRTKVVSLYRHVWKVAAVFVLAVAAVVLYFFQGPAQTVLLADAKSETPYYLPDSSKVWLNAGAKLTYDSESWKVRRKVQLHGEAYFEVAKGKRFEVLSKNNTVAVLGTAFNIRSLDTYYEVVCYEGRVKVTNLQSEAVLGAGQQAKSIGSATLEQSNVDQKNMPSWLEAGFATFEEVPLNAVLQSLATSYQININYNPNKDHQIFTGTYPLDNLKLALDAVLIPAGYAYEIEQDEVILKRE